MKKGKNLILILLSVCSMLLILRLSFAFYGKENAENNQIKNNSIVMNEATFDDNNYEKVFSIRFNNSNHVVKIIGKSSKMEDDGSALFSNGTLTLYFDDTEVKTITSRTRYFYYYTSERPTDLNLKAFDFSNLYEMHDLDEEDIYFIQGIDEKTYLGISFGQYLLIVNSNGKILKHKPFEKELGFFSHIVNLDEEYNPSSEYKSRFVDENGDDIVTEYFYENSAMTMNNKRSSTKVEGNKIYSFIIAPDYFGFADTYLYLYENEYIINNDEILYRNLNKYKIYDKQRLDKDY